jgi:hypothetical protein
MKTSFIVFCCFITSFNVASAQNRCKTKCNSPWMTRVIKCVLPLNWSGLFRYEYDECLNVLSVWIQPNAEFYADLVI